MKEGTIYVLANFKVKDYVGDETSRPVRNNKHIYFTTHTKCEKDIGDGLRIERHAFDLFYFGEMQKLAKDNRQTVDVTFFDAFGVEFEQKLRLAKQQEVVVLICAAKIGLYEGAPNLTNYPATRIHFNPPHYCTKALEKRLQEPPTERDVSPPPEDINYPTMTLTQITALPKESNERKIKCKVKVTKVEEGASWFYAVCTKCPNEILKEQGIYKCTNCNRIIPYPDKRFRICTLCSDNTGSVAIIFHDDEVSRILGKTVFDIEAQAIQAKQDDSFPPLLKSFENKVFNITLEINCNNIKKGSRVYDAFEIGDKIESGGNFDPEEELPSDLPSASTVNLKDDGGNTPNTGVSSTKSRPRSNVEAVTFDAAGEMPLKQQRHIREKLLLHLDKGFTNPSINAFQAKMAHRYATLSTLKADTTECRLKIKVRITRLWRGISKTGEEFTCFNILLQDDKNSQIHAFIPAVCAHDLERKIIVGGVYIISVFTVQAYLSTDKYSELKPFANQTTYMIDVVGIIRDHKILLNDITNRLGQRQVQAKFAITDGSSNINVTFWDKFAEQFVNAVWEQKDNPVIIIIAACRVQLWNNEPKLGNVSGTKFYLNCNHHSVNHLRIMLTDPEFLKKVLNSNKARKAELYTVEAIKTFDKEFVEEQVLAHLHIVQVDTTQKWFLRVCTSCDSETEPLEGMDSCPLCQRIVPYPELRFRIVVLAKDATGSIQIILRDREIRSLIGKRARDVVPQDQASAYFPKCFTDLAGRPFTFKLEIATANIGNHSALYWATNVCNGFKLEATRPELQQTTTQDTQATTSTHQQPSDLNQESSTITNSKELSHNKA
uniref:Replication factor A C-terminal domain-containing protein n=1 Tax=Daucus carota subsp. sativus TaxID=79200 RepID=A0A161XYQ7_DAUCS